MAVACSRTSSSSQLEAKASGLGHTIMVPTVSLIVARKPLPLSSAKVPKPMKEPRRCEASKLLIKATLYTILCGVYHTT